MKILNILQRLIKENSDPNNPDSYPSHDEWTMKDWQTYYKALVKKWGNENDAKRQFLRYWEPIYESFLDEPAEDELDDESTGFKNWFIEKEMWNKTEERPYTLEEFNGQNEKKPIEINKDLRDGTTLKISPDNFFNHLKKSESIKYDAYQDSGGVWTIGYGHTNKVYPGQKATDEQIQNWLLEDITEFEKCVTDIMKSWKKQGLKTYMITQGQFDAMVSFAFNVGCGGLRSTKFIQLTKEGKHNEAAEMMKTEKLTDRKGKKLEGLVKRRNNESNLYLS